MRFLYRRLILIAMALSLGASMSACSVFSLGRSVTLTYDTAGLADEEPYEGTSGSSFRLPVPECEGYSFDGWFYDAEFMQQCGKIISLDQSRTLYAKWTKTDDSWAFSPLEGGTAFKVTAYTGADTYVRIPSEYEGKPVTAIGAQFLGKRATKVHGIFIPDSVTSIEDYAFYNTAYLEEIEIPASVTKLGSRVFAVDAVDTVLRKFVYIDGDPAVTEETFYDKTMSFQIASVVADENTAAYRLFLRQNSYNAGVVDATGIDPEPTPTEQYAAHLGAGDEHALAYDALPVRPALNASMVLMNLRFGYASDCAEGSVAARVTDAARQALYTYVRGDMTPFEKVHAIYDYVTATVTYDEAVVEEDILETWLDAAYNLEGVFLNRVAVCDGISKAVELLCRMEGIECVRVIGESSGAGHAWNKVKLDGAWYLLDATFGDTEISWTSNYRYRRGEFTDHAMMLTTDDAYHTPDPPFASGYEATDGARSYFTSVVYGGGYDLLLDSTAEMNAFLTEYADALRGGEVVNFALSCRTVYEQRRFLETMQSELSRRGLSGTAVLESNNGSYFLLPSSAQAISA